MMMLLPKRIHVSYIPLFCSLFPFITVGWGAAAAKTFGVYSFRNLSMNK